MHLKDKSYRYFNSQMRLKTICNLPTTTFLPLSLPVTTLFSFPTNHYLHPSYSILPSLIPSFPTFLSPCHPT